MRMSYGDMSVDDSSDSKSTSQLLAAGFEASALRESRSRVRGRGAFRFRMQGSEARIREGLRKVLSSGIPVPDAEKV